MIDYASEDFVGGTARYDVICHTLGISSFAEAKGSLAPSGRYVCQVLRLRLLAAHFLDDPRFAHARCGASEDDVGVSDAVLLMAVKDGLSPHEGRFRPPVAPAEPVDMERGLREMLFAAGGIGSCEHDLVDALLFEELADAPEMAVDPAPRVDAVAGNRDLRQILRDAPQPQVQNPVDLVLIGPEALEETPLEIPGDTSPETCRRRASPGRQG
ncbi:hypothetical protein [Sagittula sp. S175]|uniref:hypothetical protein n=1 Tax=Sagittula sp. S175 TaxID=3415129 RepID=UPI003C7D33D9